MNLDNYVEYKNYPMQSESQGQKRAKDFYELMNQRRSIRRFSDKKVPRSIIENAIKAAGTAPSGANKQPWFFAAIESPDIKKKIRRAAEIEEQGFYDWRAGDKWLKDLAPLGTNAEKPHLETASTLIAVFCKTKEINNTDKIEKTYYPMESTGIAMGILLTALHTAGLGTLTHTPTPMGFLNEVLGLDKHYKPLVLVIAGYPMQPVLVPNIERKPFNKIARFY